MDRLLIADAVRKLELLGPGDSNYASPSAVAQFNALLCESKRAFLDRPDIQAIHEFERVDRVAPARVADSIRRLLVAVELRPPATTSAILEQIRLPVDVPENVKSDFDDLQNSVATGLLKPTLLLVGLIAESLLLSRHSDRTDRGPGLAVLVKQATEQHLYGTDTLRHLASLVDYRDLIHPRTEIRNRTVPNQARIEAALIALKLLCADISSSNRYYKS